MSSGLRYPQALHPEQQGTTDPDFIQVPVRNRQPDPYAADLPAFTAALQACREAHPLPVEQPILPDQLIQLAARLEPVHNRRTAISLAHELTLRERKLLIPLVAALETNRLPATAVPARRIRPLIQKARRVLRANPAPSLYETGWYVLQQSFPAPRTAAALGDLCRSLPRQKAPDAEELSQLPPHAQHDPVHRRIDELLMPGSPRFLLRLSAALARRDLPVNRFFKVYSIHPEQPLGANLVGQCFLNSDHAFFRDAYTQFNRALPYMTPDYQVRLVYHLFSQTHLDTKIRNSCYQTVFRLFGDPDRTFADTDNRHPLWARIRRSRTSDYRTWIIAATIGTQCRDSRRKAGFFLRYLDAIISAERNAENTMTVHFPRFMLQDDLRHPDLIFFQANRLRATTPDQSPLDSISVAEALERVRSRWEYDRSEHQTLRESAGRPGFGQIHIPAVIVLDLSTAESHADSHEWVQMHLRSRGSTFR